MDNGPNKRLKMEKKENESKEHSPTLPVNICFIYIIFTELFKYFFNKWYVCCFINFLILSMILNIYFLQNQYPKSINEQYIYSINYKILKL
jgi:hypothetical protein